MRTLLVFIFLTLWIFQSASAQESLEQRVFKLIYNQDYNNAESLLQDKRDSINPMYFLVLDIDLSYWENVTGTDQPNYAAFEKKLETYSTSQVGAYEEKAVRLITLSYKLRYQLKRYQLLRAISTRKKTMELFNELKSNNQKLNGDQQQLFELYNALIQYFNNYLKPFFVAGKQEEMQNAILDMEKLGQSSQIIIHTLSAYFLGKIYLNYENQPEKGLVYFQWLSSEYPENKKFGELLLESGKKP